MRGAIRGHNIIGRIVYYISYKLHPRSFDNFKLILQYTLWNVQHLLSNNRCRQYSSNKIVDLQAITMKCQYFTCSLIYITAIILYRWDTWIDFSLWNFSATHEFQQTQPTFQGVPGNIGLALFFFFFFEGGGGGGGGRWGGGGGVGNGRNQRKYINILFLILFSIRSVITSSRSSGETLVVKMYWT